MEAAERALRRFKFWSGLSCWSLLAFGVLSAVGSVFSRSGSGIMIGLALIAHGAVEWWQRRLFFGQGSGGALRWLAGNQLALAVSVSVYLLYSWVQFESDSIRAMLAREPIRTVLELYPPDLATGLYRDLPRFMEISYLAMIAVVVVGGGWMALYYLREGRKCVAAGLAKP